MELEENPIVRIATYLNDVQLEEMDRQFVCFGAPAGWEYARKHGVPRELFEAYNAPSAAPPKPDNAPEPEKPRFAAAPKPDPVNRPDHYTRGKIEVIDFIEDQKLDFRAGNVVKYVVRSPHKGKRLEDLKKARWYLERLIKEAEGDEK